MKRISGFRIGTRGSKLALHQAAWVGESLRGAFPGLGITLVTIKTRGDKILDSPLSMVGGKGLFVKEIEEALLAGQVDIAVHSVKDVPAEMSPGLAISAIPQREDPRDVLISRRERALAELPLGAKVGTSSLRRRAQLLFLRKDLTIVPVRGNVDTRMRKLDQGELDAIVLAAAAVHRLGLQARVTEFFSEEDMVPAVGQGALAVQTRTGDGVVAEMVQALDNPDSRLCVEAERAFLRRLGGGCQVPVGAYVVKDGVELELRGMVAAPDGDLIFRERMRGPLSHGVELGQALAERIIERGAGQLLASLGIQEACGTLDGRPRGSGQDDRGPNLRDGP